ncbi:MAG TPA: cytochrome P450 [Polyangium sp.]|nr:cytochrome P450 [Polyangium sp.]
MLLDTQILLDPFPMYREFREKAPVLWAEVMDSWLLFRYEDVKRAMEDADAFSSENPLKMPPDAFSTATMVFQDDPNHARLRAFAQPAFTPRRVAMLEQRIKELCDDLLAEMADKGGAFDLVRAFTGPLPAMVIAELLGVPRSDFRTFQRIADDVVHIGTKGKQEQAQRAGQELAEYYAALVAEKRRTGALGNDLTSDFLRSQGAGANFSDREIVAMGPLFLFAGHETTTNLLNNTVRCLSETPEAKAFLLADLGRAPRILEEVLRCRGPATGAPRIARRDIELHGVTIPAGSRVWPLSLSANRDPRVFDDPERFLPDRNPKNILSFGRGIHKCLGEPLARLEAKIAVPALYRRFPELRVDPERPAVPTPSPLIHGCLELPVRI